MNAPPCLFLWPRQPGRYTQDRQTDTPFPAGGRAGRVTALLTVTHQTHVAQQHPAYQEKGTTQAWPLPLKSAHWCPIPGSRKRADNGREMGSPTSQGRPPSAKLGHCAPRSAALTLLLLVPDEKAGPATLGAVAGPAGPHSVSDTDLSRQHCHPAGAYHVYKVLLGASWKNHSGTMKC